MSEIDEVYEANLQKQIVGALEPIVAENTALKTRIAELEATITNMVIIAKDCMFWPDWEGWQMETIGKILDVKKE